MAVWKPIEDIWMPRISNFVRGFESDPFVAYYIRNREDINALTNKDFENPYHNLANNYSIYFLFGDETSKGGKKTIYIGQASERKYSKGLDRLKEHLDSTRNDSYLDRWSSALVVTHENNKWNSAVLNNLESVLIELFKQNKNFTCLNTDSGRSGNIQEYEFDNAFNAILDLLKLPIFGYDTGKNTASDVETAVRKVIIETLEDMRKQQNQQTNEEITKLKQDIQDLQSNKSEELLWVEQVKRYDTFRKQIASAGTYNFNGRVIFGSTVDEVLTKPKTAEDQVKDIEPDEFNSTNKFLDEYCKSGNYIIALIDRFLSDDPALPINHEPAFADKLVRLKHILTHQLYAICNSDELFLLSNKNILDAVEDRIDKLLGSRKGIFDSNIVLPNITVIHNLREIVKSNSKNIDAVKNLILQKFRDQGALEENMKFDVVIGNPPYNNDLYIDFVILGHALSNKCSSMITPAKWQANGGLKTEQFRKDIVPHMSKIVYF